MRGTAALKCSQCSANPVHWACVAGTKYAGQCATCGGETMEAWRRVAGGGAAGPSEIIDLRDLEGEGAGAAEVVGPTQNGPREEAVESAGGTVVGTDEVSAPRFFAGADKVAGPTQETILTIYVGHFCDRFRGSEAMRSVVGHGCAMN